MKKLNRKTANVTSNFPERILQFGGGNFLRGFTDWIIDKYNRQSNHDKLGVLVAKVRKGGSYQPWKDQDGLYHFITRGYSNGKVIDKKTLITCISRIVEVHNEWKDFLLSARQADLNIIISNTTETGLRFDELDSQKEIPSSFPGQLCHWLYERFKFYKGSKEAKCIIIPSELLDHNGQVLKDSILRYSELYQFGDSFNAWVEKHCHFCNTLVDRIVPGISKDRYEEYHTRLGYDDHLMTEGEPYHLWAIETGIDLGRSLPLNRIGLNVIYTKDLHPFKERKIKILNGAHTSMVPIGLLTGVEMVKDVMNDEVFSSFMQKLIYDEILTALDVDFESCEKFAAEVLDRFRNPFLDHYLKTISLYTISKFNARIKPSIKAYVDKKSKLPYRLCLAFAAILVLYRGGTEEYDFEPNDEPSKVDRIKGYWEQNGGGALSKTILTSLLADLELWKEDLNQVEGFSELVLDFVNSILQGDLGKKLQELS